MLKIDYYEKLFFACHWQIFNPHMHKIVPRDPITICLVTIFTQRMSESSDSMYSSILMLENIWCHHFTYSEPNSQEIVNFYQFSLGLWGLAIGTKFTISCEFSPLHVKWGYHLFSSMKKEEYIESEFSGIFQVKVASKDNWFPRDPTQSCFAVWCLFLKKHTNFLNQTVTLKCFPC